MRMCISVARRADGSARYWIQEYWREDGKPRTRWVVGLGGTADPAEALAAMKRRMARMKRRMARLGPRAVRARPRLERSMALLSIRIAKIEMYLGGPRLMVVERGVYRLYQRTDG